MLCEAIKRRQCGRRISSNIYCNFFGDIKPLLICHHFQERVSGRTIVPKKICVEIDIQ
jgi:hypothetical protein